MRIAVDVAVWRVQSIGLLAIATAVAGIIVSASAGSPGGLLASAGLAAAGVALATSEAHLIVRPRRAVHERMLNTINLLSLPSTPDPQTFSIVVPMVVDVQLQEIAPNATLVTLACAGFSEEREDYLCRTLIKYQRTIQTIL